MEPFLRQKYDSFVSYSPRDREWVHHWLVPRLEERGLKVCIDTRDFEPGVPTVQSIERAILSCRHTIIVLTQEWIESDWAKFHLSLAQHKDPAARIPYILPIMLRRCELPLRLSALNHLDFTNRSLWPDQIQRLISAISINAEEGALPIANIFDDSAVLVEPGWISEPVVQHAQDPTSFTKTGQRDYTSVAEQLTPAKLVASMILQEVRESLSQTTIFRKREYCSLLKDVAGMQYYAGIGPESLVSPEELDSSFAASLGLTRVAQKAPRLRERISVSLPVTMVGAIALFTFLDRVQGIDLVLDYSCCNGSDVMRKINEGKANAAVLPIGGASTLIRQQSKLEFFPLILMPAGSYAIMSQPAVKSPDNIQTLAMPISRPSSAVSYCDELKATGNISKDIRYEDTEYDQAIDVLLRSETDTAVAQWFPNYKFSEQLGYRVLVRNSPSDGSHYSLSTFLFLRGDLFSDPLTRQWLSASLRDAWLELIEKPESLTEIVGIMLRKDVGFLPKALARCSGLSGVLSKSGRARLGEVR